MFRRMLGRPFRLLLGLVVLALLAGAATPGVQAQPPAEALTPVGEAVRSPESVSAPVILGPVRGSLVPVQDLTVRWEAVPGALHYRLVLYDGVTGSPLLDEGAIAATAYTIRSRYLRGDRRYAFALAAVGLESVQWSYGSLLTAPVPYALTLSAQPNPAIWGHPVILSAAVQPATNVKAIRLTSTRTGLEIGRIPSTAGQVTFTPSDRTDTAILAEALDDAGNPLVSRRLELPVHTNLSQPDLTVTHLAMPESVQAGAELPVQWAIHNAGPAVDVSFVNYLYLRGRGGEIPLDSWREPGMAANAERQGTRTVSIPETEKGAYTLCLYADVNAEAAEADEGNNTRCGAKLTITAPPTDPPQPPPPPPPVVLPVPGAARLLFPGAAADPSPWLATTTPMLAWESAADAEGYQVVIRRYPYTSRDQVYAVSTGATSLQVPPTVLALGGWYQWEVRPVNTSKVGPWTKPLYFRVGARYQLEASATLVESTGATWIARIDLTLRDKYGEQPVTGELLQLSANQGHLEPTAGATDSQGSFTTWLSFPADAPSTRLVLRTTLGNAGHTVELFPPGTPGHDIFMSHRLEQVLAENLTQARLQLERAEGLARALCDDPACQVEAKRRFLLAWLRSVAATDRWQLQRRPEWRGESFQWQWNKSRVTVNELQTILLGAVGKSIWTWSGLTPEQGLAELAPFWNPDDPLARRGLEMGFDYHGGAPAMR